MRRTVPFANPLSVPSSPNPIRSYPAEEILERRGESSIWFKMQPCPCPSEKRYPDCPLCLDGYVRTFPKTFPLYAEPIYRIEENRVYTRYAPIASVQAVTLGGASDGQGTQSPGKLGVMEFGEDWIDLTERLEYWKSLTIDYEVKMYEDKMIECDADGSHKVMTNVSPQYLVGIDKKNVANIKPDGSVEPIIPAGFGFDNIVFDRPVFGKIRAVVSVYSPINIGYRTYDVKFGEAGTKVFMEDGDVELVAPTGAKMGRGDIITLMTSTNRTAQVMPYHPGSVDSLPYSPIAKISEVYSRTESELVSHEEGKDFVIINDYQIKWLENKKPQGGYSIQYEYHPSFRITMSGENGSPENRKRPLIYHAKAISGWRARV